MGHNCGVSGYMISIGFRELMGDQRTPDFGASQLGIKA